MAGAESVLLAFDDEYDTDVAMAEAPHGAAPALSATNLPIRWPWLIGLRGHPPPRRRGGPPRDEARLARVLRVGAQGTASGVRTPDLGGAASKTDVVRDACVRGQTKLEVCPALGTSA